MNDSSRAALFKTIRDRLPQDPLAGVKLGAGEVRLRLLEALASPQGVHVESLLAAVGALAGQATQASLRFTAEQAGRPPLAPFQTLRTKDGRCFVTGEALNRALASHPHSLWSLAAAEAIHLGCANLPELDDLFAYGIKSLGTEHFGRPLVPDQHQPSLVSLGCLPELWPVMFHLAREFCPAPSHWPILFSITAQQVISMGRSVIDPCIALRIVMDTAIANSKLILADN